MGWQDDFWKDRPAELKQFGEAEGEGAKVAAGWYGKEAASVASTLTPLVNTLLPEQTGFGNIDDRWVGKSDLVAGGSWQDQVVQAGDLSKREEKLKFLDAMTENISADKVGSIDGGNPSGAYCGAQALVAAAIMGGGNAGLNVIMNKILQGETDDEGRRAMAKLRDKIASGHFDTNDVDKMTAELNMELRDKQVAQDNAYKRAHPEDHDFKGNPEGVSTDVLKGFIGSSRELTSYMKEGHMSIDSVDANGAAEGGGHFILSMSGENGSSFVYDPYARKDGHQLVFNPLEVKNYHQAVIEDSDTHKKDRITAADYGGTPFDGMY